MSAFSILNNAQATSALFNLGKTQKSLNMVQERINTGLRVGSAKDNASTFSVSLGMKNDVAGFKAIRETIALGKGTVDVALNASERVSELLSQLKEKTVQAQSENVDRAALQRDISQVRDQINTIVSSAQFNGVNLVGDSASAAAGKQLKVLASLDRASASAVPTPSFISVGHQNIGTSQLGKTSATDSIDTINVDRSNLGKVAGVQTATVNTTNGAADVADGNQVTINVRDQQGNLYAFTMTAVADTAAASGNANAFISSVALGDTADADSLISKLQAGNVQGVQIEDANGQAVATADASTITFSDTGLTVAAAGANGFTVTDANEANAYSMAQLGQGPTGSSAPESVVTNAATAEVGTQTFVADANNALAGFEESTLSFANALVAADSVTLRLTTATGEDVSVSVTGGTPANAGAMLADFEAAILTETGASSLVDLGIAITDNAGTLEVRTTGTTDGLTVRGFTITSDTAANTITAQANATMTNERSYALTLEAEIEKVETAVQQMQEITATFGSISQRLDMQDEFLESLTNTLNDGISQMIDANMAEESAKFQALQVQQQLGLQALSIANQAPQAVLGLFR